MRRIKKRKARDRSMLPFLAGVLAFMLAFTALMGWALLCSHRYKAFKSALKEDVLFCMRNDSLRAVFEGEEFPAVWETAETILWTVTESGMGKKYRGTLPEESRSVALKFGNGNTLTFYQTEIDLGDREKGPGVLVAYVTESGESYVYDTDRISWPSVYYLIRGAGK